MEASLDVGLAEVPEVGEHEETVHIDVGDAALPLLVRYDVRPVLSADVSEVVIDGRGAAAAPARITFSSREPVVVDGVQSQRGLADVAGPAVLGKPVAVRPAARWGGGPDLDLLQVRYHLASGDRSETCAVPVVFRADAHANNGGPVAP